MPTAPHPTRSAGSVRLAGKTDAPIPPQPAEPDTKDWTWVTERPCPECGFDAGSVAPEDLPALILDASARFQRAVERRGAEVRPAPATWSTIEYVRHVADVCEVMTARLGLILAGEGAEAEFADWDQDAAAAGFSPSTVGSVDSSRLRFGCVMLL